MNVDFKISPENLLGDWGNFEDWENGAAAAPTGFILSGAGATVARDASNQKQGLYCGAITYGTATAQLYRDIPNYADYKGKKLTLGFWVKTSTASQAKITIDDGIGTSSSNYHSGGGSYEFLSVSRDIDASATQVRVLCEVEAAGTAYFDGGILCDGEDLFTDLSTYNSVIGNWRSSPNYRTTKYKFPRRDGMYIPGIKYADKIIRLRGDTIGSTVSEVRTNFDSLLKALNSGKKDLYLYDDRLIKVYLNSFADNHMAALKILKFNLRFISETPFCRYINKFRKKQIIAASPTTFQLTVNGNVYSQPIISCIANQAVDITSITLENLTSGENLSYVGTVTLGNTLEIDCEESIIENNGTDDIANFTGDFLKLVPGTNQIKFTGSFCTIKIDWFDRWH